MTRKAMIARKKVLNVTLIAGGRFSMFLPRHKNISSRDREGGPLPGEANQTKSPQIFVAGRAERSDGLILVRVQAETNNPGPCTDAPYPVLVRSQPWQARFQGSHHPDHV